ncbi:hypothetical protein Tco_0402118 [Tanacetum coccineum]
MEEKSLIYNTSFLGEYECSSLALKKRRKKLIVNHEAIYAKKFTKRNSNNKITYYLNLRKELEDTKAVLENRPLFKGEHVYHCILLGTKLIMIIIEVVIMVYLSQLSTNIYLKERESSTLNEYANESSLSGFIALVGKNRFPAKKSSNIGYQKSPTKQSNSYWKNVGFGGTGSYGGSGALSSYSERMVVLKVLEVLEVMEILRV